MDNKAKGINIFTSEFKMQNLMSFYKIEMTQQQRRPTTK